MTNQPYDAFRKEFMDRILKRMAIKQLLQSDLLEVFDVKTTGAVSKLLSGASPITMRQTYALAEFFDVPFEELFMDLEVTTTVRVFPKPGISRETVTVIKLTAKPKKESK